MCHQIPGRLPLFLSMVDLWKEKRFSPIPSALHAARSWHYFSSRNLRLLPEPPAMSLSIGCTKAALGIGIGNLSERLPIQAKDEIQSIRCAGISCHEVEAQYLD